MFVFRPGEHRMRCWPRTNSFGHCTTSHPPNRPSNRDRIDRQSNPLRIFEIFSARWTPNAMLTTYKQFWTLYDFRTHRIGYQIGTESMARAIYWRFWHFFRPHGRRMRCWPCRNSFEHFTISGSTESAINSVPNRRSEQSAGRGFKLSAFYALIC